MTPPTENQILDTLDELYSGSDPYYWRLSDQLFSQYLSMNPIGLSTTLNQQGTLTIDFSRQAYFPNYMTDNDLRFL